jgi:P-loop containing NTP hydrolase pore-1
VFSAAIDGAVYAKHGTTIETRLTVIDRVPADDIASLPATAGIAPDLPTLLDWVVRCVPARRPLVGTVAAAAPAIASPSTPRTVRAYVAQRQPVTAAPASELVATEVAYEPIDWTPTDASKITDALYESYALQSIRIPGAHAHPTELVQSAAMASVAAPKPSYRPHLPANVIADGILSDAQLESVIYAGEAHSEFLAGSWTVDATFDVVAAAPDHAENAVRFRRGWFLGDGTGAGKGRQVAGILLDNWLKGRRRAVWISKSDKLIEDAQRDWSALGMERLLVTPLSRFRQGTPIRLGEAVLFTTYATLRTDERGEKLSRVQQIVEWLGSDFDGVIVFDESHAMQNAVGGKGERGDQAASQQGRAGLRLQHALPNARVVYVSATGATTVHNLAYAQRLGLWGGNDFPFATRAEFVEAIEEGGVAAMEVLARDLKALGLYAARSLSYEGVEYELVEHQLMPEQIRIYDAYAGAFSIIHNNLDAAMRAANITGETGTLNAQAKSAARSAFESAKQRFLDHASYCSPCAPCLFEEVRLSVDGPDPDAFLSSGGDEDGLQFAAFNSLQHGLPRHAKFRHGCKHRYIPVQRLICEAGPQFVAEANAPGSARCDLLALNQAVLKVTKQRRCCDAKRGRGLSKRYDLAHGSATGFARTRGNLLPSPQPLDSVYVKPMPSCCFASLHVEDGSNNSVGVLFGQTPHQSHGLLIRLDRRGTRARQGELEVGELTALPSQDQVSLLSVPINRERDVLNESSQQLLAVARRSGPSLPHSCQIRTQIQKAIAFLRCQDTRTLPLSPREFDPGCFERLQTFFPFPFQGARYQTVVGVHGLVAPLRPARGKRCSFHVVPPLFECGFAVAFDLLSRGQRGGQANRLQRFEECASHVLLNPRTAHRQAESVAAIPDGLAWAVIVGHGIAAVIADTQPASAVATQHKALEERAPFSDSATPFSCRLTHSRMSVLFHSLLVSFEGLPIDVCLVMVPDENRPLLTPQTPHALAARPLLVQDRLTVCSAVSIGACVDRRIQDAIYCTVFGLAPTDIARFSQAAWEFQTLIAEPFPHAAHRTHLSETSEDGPDGIDDGFVGMEKHFAIRLAPDKAYGQAPAQFSARRLVPNTAIQTSAQHMQLRLAHSALEPQQQTVVEQRWMIDPVSIADKRVCQTGELDETMPISIVARQPGDLQPKHESDASQCDISGELSKAGACHDAGAGKAEIRVDDRDSCLRPAKLTRALRQGVLPLCRFTIVLDLSGARLAQIDDSQARQMAGSDLGMFSHRLPHRCDAPRPAYGR